MLQLDESQGNHSGSIPKGVIPGCYTETLRMSSGGGGEAVDDMMMVPMMAMAEGAAAPGGARGLPE